MGFIAANLLTAGLTALLTSLFWIVAYEDDDPEVTVVASPVAGGGQPQPAAPPAKLILGPTGLAIPVAGLRPEQLADTFEQIRAGGARLHDAMDIMAPTGTPVIAAAPGVVEKLFLSEGGGITAYVRSTDGRWIYYYAHLQGYAPSLREGMSIARGDPIGTVGSTGNANPHGPHLHFAIHRMEPGERWHQGTPINPYPLLVSQS
jgi:murein DD-endopeptidase MepM/ murein hydrolase activator NlpD